MHNLGGKRTGVAGVGSNELQLALVLVLVLVLVLHDGVVFVGCVGSSVSVQAREMELCDVPGSLSQLWLEEGRTPFIYNRKITRT